MILLLLGLAIPQDKPVEEKVTIPGSTVSFTLVRVPGGRVAPGPPDDPSPREFEVRPFLLGKHEVTWKEFDLFYAAPRKGLEEEEKDAWARPSMGKEYMTLYGIGQEFLEPVRPAFGLRWHSALAYCDWLSWKTGRRFRLPTEAEWEFAARAGVRRFAPVEVDAEGWHDGNSGRQTHEGGKKNANAFGLHDMLGNVWEYCLDAPDGPVLRGGSWTNRELPFSARSTVNPLWYEADPSRPRSTWWFSGGFNQGLRVVGGEGFASLKEAASIEIRILGQEAPVKVRPVWGFPGVRVRGDLTNKGDRTIEELDLTVYYLDPMGKAHCFDVTGSDRPGAATYGRCFPVMVPLANGSKESEPLRSGETRTWTVEVPQSHDEDGVDVQAGKFGAKVTVLRFSR